MHDLTLEGSMRNTMIEASDEELAHYPDVEKSYTNRGKHIKLHLTYGDQTSLIVLAKTASDYRARLNFICRLRRTLCKMGAIRRDTAR